MVKTRSFCHLVLKRYRVVTDRQTDRRTDRFTIIRAMLPLARKNSADELLKYANIDDLE